MSHQMTDYFKFRFVVDFTAMSAQKFSPAFFKRRRRSNARSVGRLRRGEIPLAAFLFCQAFFFGPLVSKKKADIKFNFALLHKGNPPLVRFPASQAKHTHRKRSSPLPSRGSAFTLRWRFGRIRGFRSLRRATNAPRVGSAVAF